MPVEWYSPAFSGNALKGFASVDPNPLGSQGKYLDLSNLHVSEEMRGLGIGRRLFLMCVSWARERGAGKAVYFGPFGCGNPGVL